MNEKPSLRYRIPLFLCVAMILLPSFVFGKPKEKTFDNASGDVFQAALRTARERHVVTYVDEKNLMLTFETGRSALADGFVANASVEAEADGRSKIIVNVQHKSTGKGGFSFNAGDRMADKFFDQITEELARNSSQKASAKAEATHVEVPNKAIGTDGKPIGEAAASASAAQTGTITVTSSPDGADLSVDGSFVGNTPATLKLSSGKHTISVVAEGFKSWTRDLAVMAGAETRLNASLSK